MDLTLDDLLSLVKQRGTADNFPEREELHGLLEPFRELADQESLRLALAAAVRKGDRLVARVASEALAFLGKEASGPLLVAIALDEALTTTQRAAAVWAMDHHMPAFRTRLSPDEQFVCISLPVFEMLEDPEADRGFGLRMLLGSYASMAPAARDSFLSAIAHAARTRGHRMAGLCMHLLAAEKDEERRRRLLDLVAADASQEAVDLLATFAAKAGDAREAKHARRQLHVLRAKGLRGVVRPDFRECRALVTGVDGDACFAVNIILPRVPTFDVANLLFHLETGLRDGFVMENLPGRSVDELMDKVKEGCGTLSTFVPMPLAARIVDETLRVSKPSVLRDPELAKVIAAAEPALAEARKQDYAETAPPEHATATAEETSEILDSEGFESWFFESHEGTVRKATALVFDRPVRSRGKAGAKTLANRMDKATTDLVERLRADKEHLRLQKMLRHQARLLDCAQDEKRAELCRRLAVEVERPDSVFLTTMAIRAIMETLQQPSEDERPERFAEARAHLRARLAQEGHGHRKRDVACLDMAAAAHTEMVICNREAPSARRVSLAAIENAALAMGTAFVEGLLAGRETGALADGLVEELERRELFPPRERGRIAREIMTGMLSLQDGVCGEACPHRCFVEPDGDGRAAFYAEGLPWHGSDPPRPPRKRHSA
ncbi:MAG: hypothetical protein JXP73_17330 [Deltaproteobacteria bacterium]|nr:hypothetical protein [Deltaproteobacteria bacterium]